MPYSWSFRCPRGDAVVDAASATDEDNDNDVKLELDTEAEVEVEVEHWLTIRRHFLVNMRKCVLRAILVSGLIEAIRVGPMQMVFAGKHGFPPVGDADFGIAYTVGYIMSWLSLCLFTIVFVPLFSWWLPLPTPGSQVDTTLQNIGSVLKEGNIFLLQVIIGLFLSLYLFYLIRTFVFVGSQPRSSASSRMTSSTSKSWLVRLLLLASIGFSTTVGHDALRMLNRMDLARVKINEHILLVVPVQINLGILLATALQYKIEKRMERRAVASLVLEQGSLNEKAAMLEV